jgi:hypothetical protein
MLPNVVTNGPESVTYCVLPCSLDRALLSETNASIVNSPVVLDERQTCFGYHGRLITFGSRVRLTSCCREVDRVSSSGSHLRPEVCTAPTRSHKEENVSIEKAANWLIVVTALLALPVIGIRLYEVVMPPPPSTQGGGYAKGDKFSAVDRINFGEAERAIVVVVNSTCAYCTNSMDFYRRLASLDKQSPRVAMVVAGRENVSVLGTYMSTHGIGEVQFLTLGKEETRIRGTPALLLIARDGTVERAWQGQLQSAQEQSVMAMADRLSNR